MFISENENNIAFNRIAEMFFKEAMGFGLMISGIGPKPEKAREYLGKYADRMSFIKFLLEVLENQIGLRFDDISPIPYSYNFNSWKDSVPLAGYTNTNPKPLPSDVFVSLFSNWGLLADGKEASGSRCLSVAVAIASESDTKSAILHLLDLVRSGFMPDTGSVYRVIYIILLARSQTSSDQEMVTNLTSNYPLTYNNLSRSDIDTTWIKDEVGDRSHIQPLLAEIFNYAFQLLKEVRNAKSWDSWFLGHCMVSGIINIIKAVYNSLTPEIPLQMKTILSQFEEIVADTGPVLLSPSTRDIYFSHLSTVYSVMGLVYIFKSHAGSGWEDRIYLERLLIPTDIKEFILDPSRPKLPHQWQHLSWNYIKPFCSIYIEDDIHMYINVHKQEIASDILSVNSEEITKILHESIDLQEKGDFAAAISKLEDCRLSYPWNPVVYRELSIAYDMLERKDEALNAIIPALVLKPTWPDLWHTLAVILNPMGDGTESVLALAISNYFAERASTSEASS